MCLRVNIIGATRCSAYKKSKANGVYYRSGEGDRAVADEIGRQAHVQFVTERVEVIDLQRCSNFVHDHPDVPQMVGDVVAVQPHVFSGNEDTIQQLIYDILIHWLSIKRDRPI